MPVNNPTETFIVNDYDAGVRTVKKVRFAPDGTVELKGKTFRVRNVEIIQTTTQALGTGEDGGERRRT